jgi:hypothetical protein
MDPFFDRNLFINSFDSVKNIINYRNKNAINVPVDEIYTPIEIDTSGHAKTFRYIFYHLGEQDSEMEDLITWSEGLQISGRTIDDCLFRSRSPEDRYYILPGKKVDGKNDVVFTTPGKMVSECTPNAVLFEVDKEVRYMTKKFGRHGYDSFRRGSLFSWKNHVISIGQLHMFWWIRQYDVLPYILQKKNYITTIVKKRKRQSKVVTN